MNRSEKPDAPTQEAENAKPSKSENRHLTREPFGLMIAANTQAGSERLFFVRPPSRSGK